MNKIFRLIGFGLLFLLIFLIILGIYSSSKVQIEYTYHLQAPLPLIWQHMIDETNVDKWLGQFPIKNTEIDNNGIITCYADIGAKKKITTIIPNEDNRSLLLLLEKSWFNPYINDYAMDIKLKSLRDGTTEINCIVKYELKSLVAKIFNKLYYEGRQKDYIEGNQDALHKYFEKV